jgi:hypothetical protein
MGAPSNAIKWCGWWNWWKLDSSLKNVKQNDFNMKLLVRLRRG